MKEPLTGQVWRNASWQARLAANQNQAGAVRRPIDATDRLVAQRIRDRRNLLGLTRQQLAAMIGVTYQQAHTYEAGVNRITMGRLYRIAQVLDVEIRYFFQPVDAQVSPVLLQQQRLLAELSRNFAAMDSRQRQAVCTLAQAMAGEPASLGEDLQ